MGRDCARQKARLHCEQEGEEAVARLEEERVSRPGVMSSSSEGDETLSIEELSEEEVSEGEEGGLSGGDSARWECSRALVPPLVPAPAVVDLISIMVLLVKQVHLQKVGAAAKGGRTR